MFLTTPFDATDIHTVAPPLQEFTTHGMVAILHASSEMQLLPSMQTLPVKSRKASVPTQQLPPQAVAQEIVELLTRFPREQSTYPAVHSGGTRMSTKFLLLMPLLWVDDGF